MLQDLCRTCLRFHPERVKLSRTMADNLLTRVEYVYTYFSGKFPARGAAEKEDKYTDMGETFRRIYKEKR